MNDDGPFKNYGIGVGLRGPHVQTLLDLKPKTIQWLEIISENFMRWSSGKGATNRKRLHQFREIWPIAMHGVSMSLGSADSLNIDYLSRLKELSDDIEPMWISDHICWTGVDGKNLHDLYPLPYTEEAIIHIVKKIDQAQNFLGRQMLIENVSSYIHFENAEMTEWEFVKEIAERADCGILLDINNIYVSGRNHNFNPMDYLSALPKSRIAQMHLAGHIESHGVLIDTHSTAICPDVWTLYSQANQLFPDVTTMIERDDDIPEWKELENELLKLTRIRNAKDHDTAISTAQI
jgi:uncharacterized protein (UPF0276 family)